MFSRLLGLLSDDTAMISAAQHNLISFEPGEAARVQ
jgi:hypothetical protein